MIGRAKVALSAWRVVAIAETIRRSLDSGRNLLLLVEPGYEAVAAARRVARLLAREGSDEMAWRAPHHSVGVKAMIREVELAHGGMLFLDEIDEFKRPVIVASASCRRIVATACEPDFGACIAARKLWLARVGSLAGYLSAVVVETRA